ncbi:hypothetical protein FAI40_00930 [Acetobacteraceae bacterium]|nr:hypothetical protein FAI40_00930 [Acetobacteraceae bacterium]
MKFSIKKSVLLASLLPAACFFFSSPQASAQRISKINGETLNHLCSTPKQFPICDAYLSGVADSEVWAAKYDEKVTRQAVPEAFCVPPAQSLGQMRGLVSAWLKAHPETGKAPAGKAVYLALHGSYPCQGAAAEKPETEAQKAQ